MNHYDSFIGNYDSVNRMYYFCSRGNFDSTGCKSDCENI